MNDFSQLWNRVINTGLCTRCGICAGVCPVNAIGFNDNNYPVLVNKCTTCDLCNLCCPGAEVDFSQLSKNLFGKTYDINNHLGNYKLSKIGFAKNNTVRKRGSSGGIITAILLHLMRTGKIDGAIVTGFDSNNPSLVRGILAETENAIINSAKSKYQISPSMSILNLLKNKDGFYAVVGLPCQVQGIRKLQESKSEIANKIYCIIGLFCHCNLEKEAITDTIKVKKLDQKDIKRVEFRGGNWPGKIQFIDKKDNLINVHKVGYTTMINTLFELYGPERCYMCYDACAEFADISVGDFFDKDQNSSFILRKYSHIIQRSVKGGKVLSECIEKGEISMEDIPININTLRNTRMAISKKANAVDYFSYKESRGDKFPDYNIKFVRKNYLAFRYWFIGLLRMATIRKTLLRVMYSDFGLIIERIVSLKKRISRP